MPGGDALAATVKVKDIARVAGVRENQLTGYGLVFGLSGSGDSSRNHATVQSVANTLRTFGVNVSDTDIASRNVAAVIVTARLPAFAEPGQLIDVQVASSGDARSLTGGTLMLTPLRAADGRLYALAQGALSVGGYQFEGMAASLQRNHPTVGWIPSGGSIEQASPLQVNTDGSSLAIVLNEPDFTNATRIAEAIRGLGDVGFAKADHAGKVSVHFNEPPQDMVALIAQLENLTLEQQRKARVVGERAYRNCSGGWRCALGQGQRVARWLEDRDPYRVPRQYPNPTACTTARAAASPRWSHRPPVLKPMRAWHRWCRCRRARQWLT